MNGNNNISNTSPFFQQTQNQASNWSQNQQTNRVEDGSFRNSFGGATGNAIQKIGMENPNGLGTVSMSFNKPTGTVNGMANPLSDHVKMPTFGSGYTTSQAGGTPYSFKNTSLTMNNSYNSDSKSNAPWLNSNQGSKLSQYVATPAKTNSYDFDISGCSIASIDAMDCYRNKCPDEIRTEDYNLGRKNEGVGITTINSGMNNMGGSFTGASQNGSTLFRGNTEMFSGTPNSFQNGNPTSMFGRENNIGGNTLFGQGGTFNGGQQSGIPKQSISFLHSGSTSLLGDNKTTQLPNQSSPMSYGQSTSTPSTNTTTIQPLNQFQPSNMLNYGQSTPMSSTSPSIHLSNQSGLIDYKPSSSMPLSTGPVSNTGSSNVFPNQSSSALNYGLYTPMSSGTNTNNQIAGQFQSSNALNYRQSTPLSTGPLSNTTGIPSQFPNQSSGNLDGLSEYNRAMGVQSNPNNTYSNIISSFPQDIELMRNASDDPYFIKELLKDISPPEKKKEGEEIPKPIFSNKKPRKSIASINDIMSEKIPQMGIYTVPEITQPMDSIPSLIVGFPKKGRVEYLEPVTVRSADQVVEILRMNGDTVECHNTPGTGLNKKARVYIESYFPYCRSTKRYIKGHASTWPEKGVQERFIYQLKNNPTRRFIDYNKDTGIYVYEVRHF